MKNVIYDADDHTSFTIGSHDFKKCLVAEKSDVDAAAGTAEKNAKDFARRLASESKNEFRAWEAEHGQVHEKLGRWGAEQAETLKSKLQEIEKQLGGAVTDIQGYFELKTHVENLRQEIGTLREQVTIVVPVSHEKAQQLCSELGELREKVSRMEKTLQPPASPDKITPRPDDGRPYATVEQLNDAKINLEVGLQKLNDRIAEQPRPAEQIAPNPHDDTELRNQINSLVAERERRVQQSASLWQRLHWLILGD